MADWLQTLEAKNPNVPFSYLFNHKDQDFQEANSDKIPTKACSRLPCLFELKFNGRVSTYIKYLND